MNAPRFDQVNLVASDMEATLAFYRRLGVEIPDTGPGWTLHHRSAKTSDGIDLDFDSAEFAREWDPGWKSGPVLGFRVDTRARVDELYAEMTGAGYAGQREPWDAFWGARYAVVEDPDGNAVGIMSPIEDSYRRMIDPPATTG